MSDDKIRMNKYVRKNLRSRLGDIVVLKPAPDVPNFTKIHVFPFSDTLEGLTRDMAQNFLIPYFKNAYRPLKSLKIKINLI